MLTKLISNLGECNPKIYVDKERGILEVYCYSKSFADKLRVKYQITPGRKALSIKIPRLEEDLVLWYVRGLYDGDSSITELKVKLTRGDREYCYKLPRIVYKTKSFVLAQDLKLFLKSIGISSYMWVDGSIYTVAIDGVRNLFMFSERIGYLHPLKRRRLLEILLHYSYKSTYYGREPAGDGVRNSSPAEPRGPEDWSGLKPAAETPGHGSDGAVIR